MGLICFCGFGYILVFGLFGAMVALLRYVPPISWGMRRSKFGYWISRIGLCLLTGVIILVVLGSIFVEISWYLFYPLVAPVPEYVVLVTYPNNREIKFELWLRSIMPGVFDRVCLTGDRAICARAELEADDLRESWGDDWLRRYLLWFMVPPLSAFLATWYHTRRAVVFRKKKKKQKSCEPLYNP